MSTGNLKYSTAHKEVAKSASVIGFATLLSRILGFIRDLVIARLFGVYEYAQAFVVAFKIPNLFRDLVGEGAANAAIVPVFSEYSARHSQHEFWELANVVLNLLLVTLCVITLAGIAASPLLVRLIAPGFAADPGKLAATITLTRIIFPYILLVGLAAYACGVLNSLKHFSVPAFASCFLNISIIVCALVFGEGIKGLASGVLIGGLLQLLIQLPVLYKKGFRVRLFKRFRHPAALKIGALMVPRLASSSIYQLNNFVDTIFGSLTVVVGEGGVAALYFAYRLILFPLGICSTALAQAILPTFSRQVVSDNLDALRNTLSFGLRVTGFVLWPMAVGFIVLARPLIAALFQGGKFDSFSTHTTATVLVYYSIGLCAYGATKILQSCFFALKDTVTPTKVSFVALIVNIALNASLMFPMGLAGIALATSVSGIVSCISLFVILKKKIAFNETAHLYGSLMRSCAAGLCMGAVCFSLRHMEVLGRATRFARVADFLIVAALSCAAYGLFCAIFRVKEFKELLRWVSKKK